MRMRVRFSMRVSDKRSALLYATRPSPSTSTLVSHSQFQFHSNSIAASGFWILDSVYNRSDMSSAPPLHLPPHLLKLSGRR